SAQSRCFPATYACEPGPSPTSTVPSPGVRPTSAGALTRTRRSSLIAARVALPSRIVAVIVHRQSPRVRPLPILPLVEEVAGAGEVHGDAGLHRGGDDLLIPYGSAWLRHRRDSGLREDLKPVREREERV